MSAGLAALLAGKLPEINIACAPCAIDAIDKNHNREPVVLAPENAATAVLGTPVCIEHAREFLAAIRAGHGGAYTAREPNRG